MSAATDAKAMMLRSWLSASSAMKPPSAMTRNDVAMIENTTLRCGLKLSILISTL